MNYERRVKTHMIREAKVTKNNKKNPRKVMPLRVIHTWTFTDHQQIFFSLPPSSCLTDNNRHTFYRIFTTTTVVLYHAPLSLLSLPLSLHQFLRRAKKKDRQKTRLRVQQWAERNKWRWCETEKHLTTKSRLNWNKNDNLSHIRESQVPHTYTSMRFRCVTQCTGFPLLS